MPGFHGVGHVERQRCGFYYRNVVHTVKEEDACDDKTEFHGDRKIEDNRKKEREQQCRLVRERHALKPHKFAPIPIFHATKTRIAASAESGMLAASGAAARITSRSVTACTIPATGEKAPDLMFVTVRAIVPVAGMPPKNGTIKLAMPCPINS